MVETTATLSQTWVEPYLEKRRRKDKTPNKLQPKFFYLKQLYLFMQLMTAHHMKLIKTFFFNEAKRLGNVALQGL